MERDEANVNEQQVRVIKDRDNEGITLGAEGGKKRGKVK